MSKDCRTKVKVKKSISREETISFLEDLLQSFKSGTVVIQDGDNSATMAPAEKISLKLKARTKKQQSKIKLELSWKDIPLDTDEVVVSKQQQVAEDEQSSTGVDE